ncbi:hypothetical protein LCGC14_0369550 [marine sediment metagenome]|uniref:Uncharacterized protein n=1 Tax=marine sediment metagenome TaxID=412755 RepID=A0A0F9VSL2_9ZZZZ
MKDDKKICYFCEQDIEENAVPVYHMQHGEPKIFRHEDCPACPT